MIAQKETVTMNCVFLRLWWVIGICVACYRNISMRRPIANSYSNLYLYHFYFIRLKIHTEQYKHYE